MFNPYRIVNRSSGLSFTGDSSEDLQSYADRLIRLIPSEVITLYLVGTGVIPELNKIAYLAWSVICLIAVIVIRIYGTRSEATHKTQWTTVLVSSISFIIWLYVLGGVFKMYSIHIPWVGSLIMLTWTFFIPYVYKGDPE